MKKYYILIFLEQIITAVIKYFVKNGQKTRFPTSFSVTFLLSQLCQLFRLVLVDMNHHSKSGRNQLFTNLKLRDFFPQFVFPTPFSLSDLEPNIGQITTTTATLTNLTQRERTVLLKGMDRWAIMFSSVCSLAPGNIFLNFMRNTYIV